MPPRNPKMDLPTPIPNPGEERGTAEPRVVSPIPATTASEPPQRKFVTDHDDDVLGVGRTTTEVQRTAALLTKFGFLVVFAAVILAGAGIGMTALWVANQHYVAQSLQMQADQLEKAREDSRERDKLAREDAKEAAKQHREDQSKSWAAQRELAIAIREQTRAAEDTHATMKKAVEVMSIHTTTLDKILTKVKAAP